MVTNPQVDQIIFHALVVPTMGAFFALVVLPFVDRKKRWGMLKVTLVILTPSVFMSVGVLWMFCMWMGY